MKKVMLAIALTLAAANVQAAEEFPREYYVIGDFIKAGVDCERGNATACTKRVELCPVVMQNDRQLSEFIRNEHPIRSRNGGMNIAATYSRIKRAC